MDAGSYAGQRSQSTVAKILVISTVVGPSPTMGAESPVVPPGSPIGSGPSARGSEPHSTTRGTRLLSVIDD